MPEYTNEQIRNYIIKNYPTSCLAKNQNNENKNSTFISIKVLGFPSGNECEDFFYSEKLKWCGCGDPNSAKRIIRDYLRIISAEKSYDETVKLFQERFNCRHTSENPLLLCLAYTLDAAGFTEHGSSIDFCWLTKEGEMFLWLLNNNKELD